jgi:hypothetical protein
MKKFKSRHYTGTVFLDISLNIYIHTSIYICFSFLQSNKKSHRKHTKYSRSRTKHAVTYLVSLLVGLKTQMNYPGYPVSGKNHFHRILSCRNQWSDITIHSIVNPNHY